MASAITKGWEGRPEPEDRLPQGFGCAQARFAHLLRIGTGKADDEQPVESRRAAVLASEVACQLKMVLRVRPRVDQREQRPRAVEAERGGGRGGNVAVEVQGVEPDEPPVAADAPAVVDQPA